MYAKGVVWDIEQIQTYFSANFLVGTIVNPIDNLIWFDVFRRSNVLRNHLQ